MFSLCAPSIFFFGTIFELNVPLMQVNKCTNAFGGRGALKKTMYFCISGSKVMFDLVRGSFPRAQTDWWEIAGFLGWEEGR